MSEPGSKIRTTAGGFKLRVLSDIERYRLDTFTSKEPETIAWISTCIRDGDTFYDVGANVGVYSLFAAMRNPASRVFAFEPFHKNYCRLCENVALNGLTNIVPLFIGLHASSRLDRFLVWDDRVGASGGQIGTSVNEFGQAFEAVAEHAVLTMALDGFVETFGAPPPDHIKIDVDGAELEILRGMAGQLAQSKLRSVLVEINRLTTDLEHVRRMFAEAGFTDDNDINRLANHSRERRRGTRYEAAENYVFTRST